MHIHMYICMYIYVYTYKNTAADNLGVRVCMHAACQIHIYEF